METHNHKSRLGHCPGVTTDMLTKGTLVLTPEEYKSMQDHAKKLMCALEDIVTVNITNPGGTNLTLYTQNRRFFTDTNLDWKTMKLMNRPTGEVIVAPVEDSLNGKLVYDMAIGGIAKLKKPVEVITKKGKVKKVSSEDNYLLQRVKVTFQTDNWANVVGEFAFEINPKARFVDEFLEEEKNLGTVHVAFGVNSDMPGDKNQSKNHMDRLISEPTVNITKKHGETVTILEKGLFQLPRYNK